MEPNRKRRSIADAPKFTNPLKVGSWTPLVYTRRELWDYCFKFPKNVADFHLSAYPDKRLVEHTVKPRSPEYWTDLSYRTEWRLDESTHLAAMFKSR